LSGHELGSKDEDKPHALAREDLRYSITGSKEATHNAKLKAFNASQSNIKGSD